MRSIHSKQNSSRSEAISKNGQHHIVRENGHWAVKRAGDVRGTFPTQAKAIAAAKTMADRSAEIIVHGAKGKTHEVSTSPIDDKMMEIWKSIHKGTSKTK